MIGRRTVEEEIASCTRCHLASPTVAPVPFRGPTPATGAVVGEAPGRNENAEGRPLIGPAGQLLDKVMIEAEIDLDTLCYINRVSCFPDGAPTPESLHACELHFLNQLRLADPKVILLLGNHALQAFRPDRKIMSTRGQWWEENRRKFIATVHPAGVLRNQEWMPLFEQDIKEFAEALRHGR